MLNGEHICTFLWSRYLGVVIGYVQVEPLIDTISQSSCPYLFFFFFFKVDSLFNSQVISVISEMMPILSFLILLI